MKRWIIGLSAVFPAWIDSELGLFLTSDRLCASVANPSAFVERPLELGGRKTSGRSRVISGCFLRDAEGYGERNQAADFEQKVTK